MQMFAKLGLASQPRRGAELLPLLRQRVEAVLSK